MNFEIHAPAKAMYKFNEVTSLTGVKPYVLRFWETEFSQIKPHLNEEGHKIYGPEDIKTVQKIKKLLFEDKLSISDAKAWLDQEFSQDSDEEKRGLEKNPEPADENLKSRSDELKLALEQIIEKNSIPPQAKSQNNMFGIKTKEIADKVKIDIQKQSHLVDQDIINLVTAKKKLTVLLKRIDSICENRHWS